MQIALLVSKLEERHSGESSKCAPHLEQEACQEFTFDGKNQSKPDSVSVASLSIQQLQGTITNIIKAQYEGVSQNSLMYFKPYMKKLDNLRMSTRYQPPKFLQFNGKNNPKQHIAHFIETFNSASTDGNYLVKHFVRSLRGTVFNWYTYLELESIDSWEQIEREFLNHLFNICCTVSMMEFTNKKQDEQVVDYISRWRAISLDCKDHLSELSFVEMCIRGMHWGLQYIL